MSLHELHIEDTKRLDITFNELALACGHSTLGRITELSVTDADFIDHPVMERMRAADVKASYRSSVYVDKPELQVSRIVLAVMGVTHQDIVNNPAGKKAIESLSEQYEELPVLEDPHIRDVLEENYQQIIHEDANPRLLPDLMRGVHAFGDAEIDKWAGVYQPTLIRSAKWMAAWMIAHEKNEPLE